MKAITQDRYGGAQVLHLSDVPRPEAGAGELLVRVHAAGVDRGALHLMTGEPYLMRVGGVGLRAPKRKVPGVNFAGRVEGVGADVTGFSVGDEVYGAARGTFAEYVVARADQVAARPRGLSVEQAAVLPYAAGPALQGLRDHGNVQPGQQVLIVGATGAVGSIAVQMAKAFGAEVTGVCGSRTLALARSLGADHVIDYAREDFTEGARRYDLVLDVFGRTPVRRLRRALTDRGTLVIVGGEGDRWVGGLQRQVGAALLSPLVRQTLKFFVAKEDAETLRAVNELVEAGKVAPVMDRTYPLVEAAEAVARVQAGSGSGRIAITV